MQSKSQLNYSQRYVELVTGSYQNRGKAVRQGDIPLGHTEPAWRSYFSFDENIIKFFRENKALKGSYPYQIYVDDIILDYDGPDIADVHDSVKHTVKYMIDYLEIPEEWIRIYFSGGKGFHIHLPDIFGIRPGPLLPITLKATLKSAFGFSPYLDTVMVRADGLIRCPHSPHNKTAYYKSPVDITEIYREKTKSLIEIAKSPRELDFFPEITDVEPMLRDVIVLPSTDMSLHINQGSREAFNPIVYMTCMQKLLERGPIKGRRHTDMLRLASWMWKSGLTPDIALSALEKWVGESSGDIATDLKNVVQGIWNGRYSYGCFDDVMHEFCDTRCVFFKKKQVVVESVKTIRTSSQAIDALRSYKIKLAENKGLDLQSFYPQINRYQIVPGEFVLVVGDTGMGKSALVQNWVVDCGLKSLYLNLEMPEHLTIRRFIQKAHHLTAYEAMRDISKPDAHKLEQGLTHIDIISEPPQIDQLEKLFEYRKDIRLLVIDTTDVIDVPKAGNNEFFKLDVIINSLRKIAQQQNIIVIAIHHINKASAKDGSIDLQAPTGNRSTVTKTDHVLALIGERMSPLRILKSLKTRDGAPMKAMLDFDYEHMLFKPHGEAADSAKQKDLWDEQSTHKTNNTEG